MKFELEEFHRNISDEEMLNDIRRVSTELKKDHLTSREYGKYGKFSGSTFFIRFGSWFNAIEKAGLVYQNHSNVGAS